jgi:hypothetical protein
MVNGVGCLKLGKTIYFSNTYKLLIFLSTHSNIFVKCFSLRFSIFRAQFVDIVGSGHTASRDTRFHASSSIGKSLGIVTS